MAMKRFTYFILTGVIALSFISCEPDNNQPEEEDITKWTEGFEFGAVDLGLSVKWANANLGARYPGEYGDYYSWGAIEPMPTTYKYTGNPNFLPAEQDAATIKLGAAWRMPTTAEIQELTATLANSNYKWTWITDKDAYGNIGCEITYIPTGARIFFPASGNMTNLLSSFDSECEVWGMTIDPGNPNFIQESSDRAGALNIYLTANEETGKVDKLTAGSASVERYVGLPIRPVYSSVRPDPDEEIIVVAN